VGRNSRSRSTIDKCVPAFWSEETSGKAAISVEPHLGESKYSYYVGTKWTMRNGLRVIVKQGDLVDVEAEVIINPANGELRH